MNDFTLKNYDEMSEEEKIAKETIHKLGDIIVSFDNGVITKEKAKSKIWKLMRDDKAFGMAIKEFNHSEIMKILSILEG